MLEDFYYLSQAIIPFIIALIVGPIVIPLLKKLEIGQSIRKEGPKSHYKKSGTPTMGGIIFFLALVISLLIRGNFDDKTIFLLVSTLGFGLIGFIDDFLIVIRKDNEGLKPRQKLIGQIVLAVILSYLYYQKGSTELIVPFFEDKTWNLGILYIPFMSFVMVGTVNSVNLTDGLDGLASGVTIIVLAFFAVVARSFGQASISSFSLILLGSLAGFLIYNFHPARVFMGDTGSMGLGGAVSGIAMLLDLPLIIPIVGGIYFLEALSVIIQVTVYRKFNKRVFLMSPLHHHYEHKGWSELKVVFVFWSITLILSIVGYLSL